MKAGLLIFLLWPTMLLAESAVDRRLIEEGAWHFEKNCTFCHGKGGAGLIGPNLTDNYFLHGAKRSDMEQVIKNGLPEKGMPVWQNHLTDRKLKSITAYVWSLRGKNLKGKAAEGKLFKPDEKPETTSPR